MSATARKFATYEDLFDLPDDVVGEIIHGRLIAHPRPADFMVLNCHRSGCACHAA